MNAPKMAEYLLRGGGQGTRILIHRSSPVVIFILPIIFFARRYFMNAMKCFMKIYSPSAQRRPEMGEIKQVGKKVLEE